MWKRGNRGFIVSMVLLVGVVAYVVITWLALLPEEASMRKVAQELRAIVVSATQLPEDQIAALKDPAAMVKEREKQHKTLSALFVKDSAYFEETLEMLMGNLELQIHDMSLVTARTEDQRVQESIHIEQDTATITQAYVYNTTGRFWDYASETLAPSSEIRQTLNINIVCKKVDGEWKLYRVLNMGLDSPAYGKG